MICKFIPRNFGLHPSWTTDFQFQFKFFKNRKHANFVSSIFRYENRSFSKLRIFVFKYLKWKRSLKVSLEKNLNFRFCFGFLPQRVSPEKFASLRRLSRVLNSQAFRVLRIFTLGTKMPLIWPKDVFEIFLRHFEYWKYTFFWKI